MWFTPGEAGIGVCAQLGKVPSFLVSGLMAYRLEVVKDAPLHKDFETGMKKLTPIIFSHGMFSFKTR